MKLHKRIKNIHKSEFGPISGTATAVSKEFKIDIEIFKFSLVALTFIGIGPFIYFYLYKTTKKAKWNYQL